MTDNVVSFKGQKHIDPSAEADPVVIDGARGLLERAMNGEIIGFQAQVVYRDKSVGSVSFGWYSLKQLGEMFVRMTKLAEQLDK